MSQTRAQREIRKRENLRTVQAAMLPLWYLPAAFCCPHKRDAIQHALATLPAESRPRFPRNIYNSVGAEALSTMAGGCKSWLIPGGAEGWGGQWQPHPALSGSQAVKDWLADCTQRSIPILEGGGFFTAGHEMFEDLGVFGTAGVMIDEDEQSTLYCQALPPSDFVFERSFNARVIRVQITYSRTAQQIVDMFDQTGDTIPEQVRAQVTSGNGDQMHEVLHSIYERNDNEKRDANEGGYEPKDQPIASCWIHVPTQTEMRMRGYMEMPFMAPRWNTWSGAGPNTYGTSPAMTAMADILGVQVMDMLTGVSAELQVNPRIKAGGAVTGAIDLSPGGVTQTPMIDQLSEWASSTKQFDGEAFLQRKENQIRKAFHADLFSAIAPIAQERQLNNWVAQAIERESASRISPAMSRSVQEFFAPAMRRVFMILYRAGVFDDPPDEAYVQSESTGQFELVLPRLAMANRMTRALNSSKKFAFQETINTCVVLARAGVPDVWNTIRYKEAIRDLAISDGADPAWYPDEDEMAEIEAQQQAAQQQMLAMQTASEAIAKDPVGIAEMAGAAQAA